MHFFGYSDDSNSSNSFAATEVLMNTGFLAKEQHQYDEALNAFSCALMSQPNSSTMPYLVIEIGSILKSKGRYDEAIRLFSDAQRSPVLANNYLLQQEFTNMIAYLRITKNILMSNQIGCIPFSRIPSAIITEIDTEYAEWIKLDEAI